MFIFGDTCFANIDCPSNYKDDYNVYYNNNFNKQVDETEFKKLDNLGKREAKIRNLCFVASLNWHAFCAFTKCNNCDNGKSCTALSEDHKILGHSLKEMCNYAKIDCFTEDIDKIFSALQESGDTAFNMLMANMNDITSAIKDNKEQIVVIDSDKTVCYRVDDNGDTIWHVFVRSNKDIWNWANICVSRNENPFDMITKALYQTKNKNGKTAVQEAFATSKPENLFNFLSSYAQQEQKGYCRSMPQDISNTNGLDLKKVKSLLKCG